MTCDANYFINQYGIPQCGIWGDWGVSAYYGGPPDYRVWGPGEHKECSQVCDSRSKITSRFRKDLVTPGTYQFGWMLVPCDPIYLFAKNITLSGQSWDAPTCETCVGESLAACVHPYPRSLVLSSRPDLTLASPLGDRTIVRTYRTALVGDKAAGDGMFGKGWRANFEYRINEMFLGSRSYGVMLFDATGRKIFYSGTAGVFGSPDGKGGSISKAADGTYLWKDAQGTSYRFDTNGYILSLADVHGNQQTFGYSGGRIISLSDLHGRVVTFDYQGTNHVRRLLGPPIAANLTGEYAKYSYDTAGNLIGVAYPDGNTLSYGYENSSLPNHMTRFSFGGPQEPNLRQLFQYDAQGRVTAASEGPEGRSYQLVYDSEQVDFSPLYPDLGTKTLYHTTVTEWTDTNWDFLINGGEVQKAQRIYSYERRGGADVVTKIEDGGCSCAAEKVYDSAFHVVQSRDNNGVTSLMTYNGYGDLTSLTEAAGAAEQRTTKYEYEYSAAPAFPGQILRKITRQPSVVSPNDDRYTTEINDPATGKSLIRREQGYRSDGSDVTSDTAYAYTAAGAIQTIDGPSPGTPDQITYDYHPAGSQAAGMLWKITQPNGAVTVFQQYDGLGNVLSKTDANNRETTFSYDSRGLLQAQTDVNGISRYEYDTLGNVTKVIYPKGNSVSFNHGQSGLSRISDATGKIDFSYANGNVTSESVYDANSVLSIRTTFEYDDKNRLWRIHQPGGDFEEALYDENGNRTHHQLYTGAAPARPFKSTIQGYDSLNRLKSVSVEGDPYRVSFDYDTRGNLSTVTDPIGQVTSYIYDDFGRTERVLSPETGTTAFSRDESGHVISRRDSLNRQVSYAYDGLGRPTGITYPDATPPVNIRYDGYSDGDHPDAVGRLAELSDASGLRRFFYNASGRLSKVVHSIDEREFVTQYSYDNNGNLISLTYPDGRSVRYEYGPLSDRVESVTSWMNGIPTVLATGITHKAFGPMAGFDYGNGMHHVRGYENLTYRLDSLAVTGPFKKLLSASSYQYDSAGNINGITRDLPDGVEQHNFEYDLMNRLLGWTKPGRSEEWTYDANGNRQSFSKDGQGTIYSYDPLARNILSNSSGAINQSYEFDPMGNLAGFGTRRLVYDVNNRPHRVEDGGVSISEYLYNVDGQRAKKIAAGQTTYFEYDMRGRLIHEYQAAGDVSVDYVYLGDEPLAMLVSDKIPETFMVTPSAGANGTLKPAGAQEILFNQTATFAVVPDDRYQISSVTGCGGTLKGTTYTTGPITADCTVTASFTINTHRLVTVKSGAGGGIVTSSPAGVDCGTICTGSYKHGAVVTLSQRSNPGSVFTGWSGGCVGSGACVVAMIADQKVMATFAQGIMMDVPNGGEMWKKNTSHVIRWTNPGRQGSMVKIELHKGGVLNRIIATGAPTGSRGSGSFNWVVPKSQVTGTDYRIRVINTRSDGSADISDADFTIN